MKKDIIYNILFTIVIVLFPMTTWAASDVRTFSNAHTYFHGKDHVTETYQNGITPAQLKNAYGFNHLSLCGKGQTIAIVVVYGSPTIQTDLIRFNAQFGLPSASLNVYNMGTKNNDIDGAWALETSLDVEWAHAVAPCAKILLVEAKSNSINDLLSAINYATQHGAAVVCNSWGRNEFPQETSYDYYFNHVGITYVASSGDKGAGATWPSSSPYVLSVGGTTLKIDTSGNHKGESAWSSSSGGKSKYESIPSYQISVQNIVGTFRGTPDVSMDANPLTGVAVYNSTPYNGGQKGWYVRGGTSLSAPLWAALIAIADQGRTSKLSSTDTLKRLYSLYNNGYSNNYHDITPVNNGSLPLDHTITRYNLVTGIGSPKANNIVSALTTP